MSEKIARQWLQEPASTASARNYAAHMKLISPRVTLQGVPGFDNIDYDGWSAQCKHVFENKVIKSVSYDAFKLIAETATRIMFESCETVDATDGTVNAHGVEILPEKEQDGR